MFSDTDFVVMWRSCRSGFNVLLLGLNSVSTSALGTSACDVPKKLQYYFLKTAHVPCALGRCTCAVFKKFCCSFFETSHADVPRALSDTLIRPK